MLNKNLNPTKMDQPASDNPHIGADPDYEKKLKLATLLHDQGINPVRWPQAEPAPHEAQRRYRETRQVPDEMFVVEGRLYRRDPAIAATRAQGQDALDVYLGATPKPVAELVPVAEVPLRHPLGIPGVYRNPDDGFFYLAHSGTEERGYAFDSIRKPSMDASDVNEIIRDFMETVFSCARITRECRRTFPQEG